MGTALVHAEPLVGIGAAYRTDHPRRGAFQSDGFVFETDNGKAFLQREA